MSKDFSKVDGLLAKDVIQILYGSKEISGKEEVISYWKEWLDRWNEPARSTNYVVKH